jgi:hypothetical protein
MSTFFKIKEHVTLDFLSKQKLPNQSRELLTYLLEKYKYDAVDQNDLMLDLNTHQTDGKVFKEGSKGPISRTYEFYRKNEKSGWINADYIEITKSAKEPTKDQKYIQYLEELLVLNDIEIDYKE